MVSARTSHNTSAPYALPNDAPEHGRLERQTVAIDAMMHGKKNHAPVVEPKKILEVGCGTGTMSRYFADWYPSAQEVIGVDLSPVPPKANTAASVRFLQGDFCELAAIGTPELTPETFDYVFSRMLVMGMVDWPDYIAKAKNMLAPGGWLEIQDYDIVWLDKDENSISASWPWLHELSPVLQKTGLDLRCASKLEGRLKAAGFEDVHAKKYRWMYGTWQGHSETEPIAKYSTTELKEISHLFYEKFLGGQKTPEELDRVRRQIASDYSWSEDGKHSPYYVVYGRKP